MDLAFYVILGVLLGLIIGCIVSITGASGAMLMVPVFYLVFGLPVHSAIGTSLMVLVITGSVVSLSYFKKGNVDLKTGKWFIAGALVGSQIGVLLAQGLPERALGSSFGGMITLLGIVMLLRKPKSQETSKEKDTTDKQSSREPIHFKYEWQRILVALLLGIGIGIMSGTFGAGGGLMILAVFVVVLALPLHKAIGTSTLVMAIISCSSALGYAFYGDINVILGLIVGIGSITGGIAGSYFANKIDESSLKKVMGLFFIGLGILMTFTTYYKISNPQELTSKFLCIASVL
ncbi:MAG: sulfite exporter TauE/SafE family protein [Candidatus Hermodarchaeota archaeon]